MLFVILLVALVFSVLARAIQTGSKLEWSGVFVAFSVFAILLAPIFLICMVVRFAPTSLAPERDAAIFVFKTLVVVGLLCVSLVMNAR
jgi:hypothetical protein